MLTNVAYAVGEIKVDGGSQSQVRAPSKLSIEKPDRGSSIQVN